MSDDPKGFEENPQTPLSADDTQENVIDDSIFGPQKALLPEEQSEYDAWLRKKVGRTLQRIQEGKAEFKPHDDVMDEMKSYLDRLDREAGIR